MADDKKAKDAATVDASTSAADAHATSTDLPEPSGVEKASAAGDEQAQATIYAVALEKHADPKLKGVPDEDKDTVTRQARVDGTPQTGVTTS